VSESGQVWPSPLLSAAHPTTVTFRHSQICRLRWRRMLRVTDNVQFMDRFMQPLRHYCLYFGTARQRASEHALRPKVCKVAPAVRGTNDGRESARNRGNLNHRLWAT
jgi:hypothetical protein